MRQNPCRYCSSSYEYKGRHRPSCGKEECLKCSYIKEHEKYLESKRMYERGERISDFDELMKQRYVFCGYIGLMHIEAVKSWQVRIVLNSLRNGSFYKAIKREREEE